MPLCGKTFEYSQFTIHNSQFTTHNSQLTIHNSQFTTHNSQPTTHYSLPPMALLIFLPTAARTRIIAAYLRIIPSYGFNNGFRSAAGSSGCSFACNFFSPVGAYFT